MRIDELLGVNKQGASILGDLKEADEVVDPGQTETISVLLPCV